ncbi:MAG TPA: DUF2207 domain-containing protein [Gemmatimonadales bacterium]|jgi:uncharacterized membrane protein|nr:DUF2207 domain-containing protein [Gemmatimonadales bacterium]
MRTLLLLLLSAGGVTRATAQRTLVIERFSATIRIDPSGDLHVAESITARFTGSWNGIIRSIPVKYRTPQGFNWTLRLDLESVTGEANQPLRTETSREGHYLKYKIWVPGAQDATRTFVLKYRARNGLRFFEEHDELYWNVTGDEWDVPIEAAEATIELPPGAGAVRATAFNGAYGSTARDAVIGIDERTVRISMPNRLEFHEGLTAVVGWNKGAVVEPTAADRAAGLLSSNWPLVIPVPVFLGMFWLWRRRGRDPRLRPIAVQYEPPTGLLPGEVGTLVDNRADMRDVTATMVDLAVRGYLKFEEREENKLFGLLHEREYILHRRKPRSEWSGLVAHERKVLEGIFKKDAAESVQLSELENEFYKSLADIKEGIFDRLLQKGFYRARPDTVRGWWVTGAVVAGLILAGVGSSLAARWSLTPLPFFVAGILSTIIMLGFGVVMPARTAAGARALEQVLGFEEFLGRVEAEHFERVVKTPELFDRYLPFAMALGVDRKWAKAFEDIYTQPPTWYAGSSGTGGITQFNVAQFSSRLGDFSGKASSTLSAAPRSSSGSGFSGGSSGGGGGGGGGSGF